MNRVRAATIPAFGLATVLAAGSLPAQTISGRVTDAAGRALEGVAVVLLNRNDQAEQRIQTDRDGRYAVRANPGTYRLRFEFPGFRMVVTEELTLKRDEVRDYPLQLTPVPAIALDTVVVGGTPVPRHLLDFYLRKGRGLGSFLTPQDIARWHPAVPTQLVRRLEGFDLVYDRMDPTRKLIRNKRWGGTGRACAPAIYVDGAYVGTAESYDMDAALFVETLDAIESYSSAARVPIEFNATGSECGVIVVWTKR